MENAEMVKRALREQLELLMERGKKVLSVNSCYDAYETATHISAVIATCKALKEVETEWL